MCDTTAKELDRCCVLDLIPPPPVIADYFGDVSNPEDITIIFGVYQGLLNKKSVDVKLLNNCFHSNRLDELVHARFKTQPTGYYKMFKERNIKLESMTSRLLPLPKEEHMPIYTDDQCPICGRGGFITEDKRKGCDCYKCFKMMCNGCFSHVDEQQCEALCRTCAEQIKEQI